MRAIGGTPYREPVYSSVFQLSKLPYSTKDLNEMITSAKDGTLSVTAYGQRLGGYTNTPESTSDGILIT